MRNLLWTLFVTLSNSVNLKILQNELFKNSVYYLKKFTESDLKICKKKEKERERELQLLTTPENKLS